MDLKCAKNSIEHRLTPPFSPKTNGMVERANGIIKSNTMLKNKYQTINEMNNDLSRFLCFYNFNRRHGSIRKELKVKTPFNAVEKWYQLKPEIFKSTPEQFKNINLNLNQN